MVKGPELRTNRLKLRRWKKSDLAPFAALNADPIVMEHMPSSLSEGETAHWIARLEVGFDESGFGLWAVEHVLSGEFLGFTGLNRPRFEAAFMPAVEVGWRLGSQHWGNGYATEAARAALQFGFDTAGLNEIISFTVPANTRSVKVMERLGMARDPVDDFNHPRIPEDSPLRRHVLYRMSADDWTHLKHR